MARIPVVMPKPGCDMESGIITGRLKAVGDSITRGDAIAEVETHQATMRWRRPRPAR